MQELIDRFLKYVRIDTESDPNNPAYPSSDNQWDLAKILEKELIEIGMQDVMLNDMCYITATLPSNIDYEVPTVGFVSHIDTSPDFTGANVNPQVHPNYRGQDIILNKEEDIILSPKEFPELNLYHGNTIITTDGTTLLGADDKAGVTEIVCAMEYLIKHPEIKHGQIRICFTPDEEVGKGAKMFDVEKFGAAWAYTMDGSQVGEIEYENFNAAGAKLTFKGKIVHPGSAKNQMLNSMLIANKFIAMFPSDEIPEKTDGYEGFYHLHLMDASVEQTILQYIIRDHDKSKFEERKTFMRNCVDQVNKEYGKEIIQLEMSDQYYNMKEKILPVMHIVDIARDAIIKAGIEPITKPIRGGTDGSQLSFMGLPCPNIFAGGHNFHGRHEFVPVESMMKAVEVIVNVAQGTAERYR